MDERIRAHGRGTGRSAGRDASAGRNVSPSGRDVEREDVDAVVNENLASQSRRMEEPLDESGAPVGGVDPEIEIREEIQARAYERYLERHGGPGSAEEDWREAEREVRGKLWNKGSGTEPGI